MQTTSSRPDKPGWGIIDRFMSDATPEAQEEAYENLKSLAALLVRIDERLADEEKEKLKALQLEQHPQSPHVHAASFEANTGGLQQPV